MHQLGELGTYLNAAFRREELLLWPRRDHERIKRGKPPMSRTEAMALMFAQAQFFEENPERTMQSWNAMVAEHERKGVGEEER